MFFSLGARVIAALALIFGGIEILMRITIANEWGGISRDSLSRYTAAPTTGALIGRGTHVVIAAFALGTLAEIGLATRRNSRGQ